jgi:hypothetical protein
MESNGFMIIPQRSPFEDISRDNEFHHFIGAYTFENNIQELKLYGCTCISLTYLREFDELVYLS